MAHEVGHQYFAGLVGTDPIKDPVADEALTQYASVLYFEWAHGKAAGDALRQETLVSSYHLYRMSGGEDGPAHRPTETFSSSMEYGAIVYGKAPLMFHAARKLVGDETLQSGAALVRGHVPVQVGVRGLLPEGAGEGEPRAALERWSASRSAGGRR